MSQPIPKRLKMTSTVAPSSRGSSFARTEFLSNPPKTHSSFFAVSLSALMSCSILRRGRNGLMRRVPRMLSDVVKTKRHRPESSGDSRGFGVGFSFSSASTWLSTEPRRFSSRPCLASRASAMSLMRGPAQPSLRNSSSLASQTSHRSTSSSTACRRVAHLCGAGNPPEKDRARLPGSTRVDSDRAWLPAAAPRRSKARCISP